VFLSFTYILAYARSFNVLVCLSYFLLTLVEESDNLPSCILPPRVFVCHDPIGSGKDHMTELT
jgi:hypothetical protein